MVKEGMKNIYICFPEGKHKVLTMSFDDGRLEDRRLVDIFNRYGIKGTFHVNSAIRDEKRVPVSEYRELYKGHEVSCHTCTHPTIARCPMEQVVSQILEDRRNLEAAVGYPVRGFLIRTVPIMRKLLKFFRRLASVIPERLKRQTDLPCRRIS